MIVTRQIVIEKFVDRLLPHFATRRRSEERFLSDLADALVDAQVTIAALENAAVAIIRTRKSSVFPSVADCIEACVESKSMLNDATSTPSAVDTVEQSTPSRRGLDSEGVKS